VAAGVIGELTDSSAIGAAGIWGIQGPSISAYAGYFTGRTHVAGVFSKGAGSFKIDHPLDPENRYLYHSFVESPDMMNVYNGNVVTDNDGLAIVTLPDWFEALNKDFRYQLTVTPTRAGSCRSRSRGRSPATASRSGPARPESR
jgi:hypothetical protein